MDGSKDSIRRVMRLRRRECLPAAMRTAEEALLSSLRTFAPFGEAQAVVAYLATENEVPTGLVLEHAAALGKQLFLPRVQDRELVFSAYVPGEPMVRGAYGIPEPIGNAMPLSEIGGAVVVLVPLVAWDRRGTRLGRGAGYYDRALRPCRDRHCLIGVGYDFQECTELPRDAWDVPLHFVMTEREVVHCDGGGVPSSTAKEVTNRNGIFDDVGRQHRSGSNFHLGNQPAARSTR